MNYLIHNPRCSKSRGALEILTQNKVDFNLIDYTKNELSKELIEKLPKFLGLSYLEILRVNDDLYKKLNEELEFNKLLSSELSEIIFNYPMLLERPIFIKEQKAIIARPPERVWELL